MTSAARSSPTPSAAITCVGFDFEGYWEDIGTIRSFYETNLSLTRPDAPFNFYDPVRPIYTRPRFLPGSVIDWGHASQCVLLAEGCQIHQAEINEFDRRLAQPDRRWRAHAGHDHDGGRLLR